MKIRIVNLDFYMHSPIPSLDVLYSEFRGSSVNNVPIIRIYGSTEEGQKICLHVHGVFPYFYIPYDGQLPADGFLYQIATGLDKAINVSFGQISSNVQHVYKVSLVSGIPFYGYHPKKHQFLKIYFYNPLLIKRACTLLLNGSILGKIYQPHEAHIPYILQFMIDYNLHGMSFVDLSDLKYRIDKDDINEHPEDSTLPLSVPKMSNCRIEADTQADHILNRQGIIRGKLTINPGIKALWDDEAQRRRDKGESSQIEHCLTLNRIDIPQTATHLAYKNILEEKLKGKLRIDTSEVNQSVYPAETPPSSDISDASMIEECERISQTNSSLFDETITEDLVLDDDAQQLYNLLNDLRGDNVEGDSILSQIQKENDSDEEDGDLSLPLNATQTPKKIENSNRGDVQDFLKDSYFESLGKIPQLDGTSEEISENQTRTSLGNSSNETPGKRRTSENVKENNVTKKFEGKLYTKISLFGWLGLPNRTNKILMSPPKLYLAKTAMKKSSKYINIHRTKKRNPRQSLKIKTNALFPKSKRNRLKSSCAYCLNLTSDPELLKTKSSSPCIKCYFSKITTTPSLTNVSIIKREENEEVIGTEAEGLNSTKNQDESTKIGNRKRHENDFNSYSPSKCKLKLNEGKNINESSSIGERRLIQPNQSLIEIRNEETPENDSDSSNSKRQIKKKKESNIDEVSTVKRVENQSILSIGLNLNGENDRSEDDSISKRKMKKKKESNIDELSTVKTVENQSILSTAINLIGQNEDRSEDDSISKRKMKKMKKEENIDEISTLEIFQDQSILSTAIYLIGENEERSEDDSISKRQMKNKEKEKKIDEVSTLEIFEGQSNSSIIETTPNDDQISTKIKNEGRSEDDSISKRKLKKKKNKEKNIIKRSTLDIFGDESISSTGTTLIGDWGLATIENEEKAENDPNLSISKHRMKKKKEKNTNELSTSEGLENLSISSPGISSIGDQKLTKIENEERPEDGSILKRKLKKKKEKNIFKGSTFDIFGDESTSSTGTTLIGDWELATIENVEKAENDSNFSISKRKMKKKKDKNINELSTPAGVEDDSSLTTEIITIGVQDLINIENAKKPEDDLISKRKMKKKKKEKRVEGSDVFARNGDQDLNKMENEERPEDDSNFVISKRKMKKKKEARIKEVDIFAQNGDQDLNKIENEGKPEDDSNSVISKRKMKKKKEKRIEGGDLFAQNADQDLDKIENVKKSEDDTHSKRKMKKMKEKNINKSLTLDIFGDDSISSIGTTLNGDRESAKIENEENPEDDSNFVISKRKMKKNTETRIKGGDLFPQNGDQDLDKLENVEKSEDDTHSKRKMKKMTEKNIIKGLTLDIFGDESISLTGTTLNGDQGLDKIENEENSEDDPNFSISKRKMKKKKETRTKGGDLFAQNGDQDLYKIENEEKSEDDTHSKRKMKMEEKNINKSLTLDIFGDDSISSTGTTLNGDQGLDKIENEENSEDDPNFLISKRKMKKKKETRTKGGDLFAQNGDQDLDKIENEEKSEDDTHSKRKMKMEEKNIIKSLTFDIFGDESISSTGTTLNGGQGLDNIENGENSEDDPNFSISKRQMKKKKEKRIGGGGTTLNGGGGLAQIENEENAENDSTIFSISKRKMRKKKKEKRIGGGGIDRLKSKKSKKHKSRRKREEIREIKNHQIYNIEDDRKMMKKKKHEDPLNMPSICDSPPSTHADNNNNNIEIETIINEHLPKRRRRGRKRLASIERERLARVTPSKLSIRYAICNPRYDLRPRTVSTKLVQTRASPVIKRAYTKRIIVKPELKNKRTQTTAVQLRHRKPVLNITLLRTDKINEYTIKSNPFGKYRQRIYRDLGANPKPKFRIVAASQPYEFELRNGCKYPNTTWYKSEDEQGRVKVIEYNEVVEEGDKEGTMLDPLNGLEGEYNEEISPSGEFGIVNDLTELYDEIFQGQDASSSCLDMSKIFDSFSNSQGGGDEEEFTDSYRDGKSSFADNRRKIYKSYDDLMEKIGKSFDDLFCSTERITESNAISSRRILEYVQEMERKSDDKRVVVGEVEKRSVAS